MNKLIIIGNGFDLAHGLPTRYEDFILWEINKAFSNKKEINEIDSLFFSIKANFDLSNIMYFNSVVDFQSFIEKSKNSINIKYKLPFFQFLFIRIVNKRWVDIERDYFDKLNEEIDARIHGKVKELNLALDKIKILFKEYLIEIFKGVIAQNSIETIFRNDFFSDKQINIQFLNFNYTPTLNYYIEENVSYNININYIHGEIRNENNPIIFGYGDESDDNYYKLEKTNVNEYLRHMKSFAYLQTPNYRNLFNFLDSGNFDVYILGHSCGLSDRLLFTHILEHSNFHTLKIYYHQKSELENDFFEKTQNLSRYFQLNSKHKMRTKVVPFNESKPLVPFKPKQTN